MIEKIENSINADIVKCKRKIDEYTNKRQWGLVSRYEGMLIGLNDALFHVIKHKKPS